MQAMDNATVAPQSFVSPAAAGAQNIRVAALITSNPGQYELQKLPPHFLLHVSSSENLYHNYLSEQNISSLPEVLLIEADAHGRCFDLVAREQRNPLLKGLIIVLLSLRESPDLVMKARKSRVHDLYCLPFDAAHLAERLEFLVKFKFIKPRLDDLANVQISYKLPWSKRAFDIVFASGLILALSPILLITALAVRLESAGPIVYRSKRVGTGYKIFDFYKFRSMRPDADKLLAKLAEQHNQYAGTETEEGAKTAFVKLKNDPRVTRVGQFIRSTSIDELPQLFNILKGDMSTVGNRPLPLYEADQLTTGEWALRFLGPAGLTGLWQISKRGKEDMSERERKKLDNFYAEKHSFWLDMKILIGTIPAVLQKEKV